MLEDWTGEVLSQEDKDQLNDLDDIAGRVESRYNELVGCEDDLTFVDGNGTWSREHGWGNGLGRDCAYYSENPR